jgi:CO/xanthine dehydrogenase FAD-binding subunit
MKPAQFRYIRAQYVEQVCDLLARDPEARPIAGGQTLMPLLNMRLAQPSLLIDIAGIAELSGIRVEGNQLIIGAVTRQLEIEDSALVAEQCPLLAKAMPWIGHRPTRARGTIGGSLASADPSAEIPLVAVTLGATIFARDGSETLSFAADDFFIAPLETKLPETACLTSASFPVSNGRAGYGFQEIGTRESDFAIASAACEVVCDSEGCCVAAQVGVGGIGARPERLSGLADALVGTVIDAATIDSVITAHSGELEAEETVHASAAYRRRAAGRLLRLALLEAQSAAMAR